MSLSLKESCQSYERYCRRHSDTPTFEAFNGKHFTNLPSNPEVYADFKRTLTAARRATGLPVTRRLPSLFHKLSGVSSAVVAAEPRAVVQVKTAEKASKAPGGEPMPPPPPTYDSVYQYVARRGLKGLVGMDAAYGLPALAVAFGVGAVVGSRCGR